MRMVFTLLSSRKSCGTRSRRFTPIKASRASRHKDGVNQVSPSDGEVATGAAKGAAAHDDPQDRGKGPGH